MLLRYAFERHAVRSDASRPILSFHAGFVESSSQQEFLQLTLKLELLSYNEGYNKTKYDR